jgi:hypothetical protein
MKGANPEAPPRIINEPNTTSIATMGLQWELATRVFYAKENTVAHQIFQTSIQ